MVKNEKESFQNKKYISRGERIVTYYSNSREGQQKDCIRTFYKTPLSNFRIYYF